MEDLSRIFSRLGSDPVTALAPGSMSGGNIIVDSQRQTMTAPGSEPVDPLPPADERGDMKIAVLRDSDGGHARPDNADRSNPAAEPDGHGWLQNPRGDTPGVLEGLRGRPVVPGRWNAWD
jgi:hypothetical protein